MLSDSTQTRLIPASARPSAVREAAAGRPTHAAPAPDDVAPTLARERGVACHVLLVELDTRNRTSGARCTTLPDDGVADLLEIMRSGRDWKYRLRDVEQLGQSRNWGPVAIWMRAARRAGVLETPVPLAVPFEPAPLEEEFEGLAALLQSEPAAVAGVSDRRPPRARAPRPSFTRRWMVRTGLIFFAFPLLANAIIQIALQHGSLLTWSIWGGIFALTALVLAIVIVVSDRWLLVPGGVLIARSAVGGWKLGLRLCTPADARLVVFPVPAGWYVALFATARNRPYRRLLTDVELLALLAAWQCPLVPPTAAQLEAFSGGSLPR